MKLHLFVMSQIKSAVMVILIKHLSWYKVYW